MVTPAPRAATGIAGLDDVLNGGFVRNRLYLIEGMPGSGKTTLALSFLMEGAKRGESVLYVTLSETIEEVRAVGDSHGWDLSPIHMRELGPPEGMLDGDQQYTVFHPSEVELSETTQKILADIEKFAPTRIVFDSLSELRMLAGNPLRYRRQILALKQYFIGRGCTVLMLDDLTSGEHDINVQSICHGALMLEHTLSTFGVQRRRHRQSSLSALFCFSAAAASAAATNGAICASSRSRAGGRKRTGAYRRPPASIITSSSRPTSTLCARY